MPCEISPDEFNELCPSGKGFKVVDTLTGPSVTDINECNVVEDLCRNGQCVNARGSFRCQCNQGHSLDQSGRDCIGETN